MKKHKHNWEILPNKDVRCKSCGFVGKFVGELRFKEEV